MEGLVRRDGVLDAGNVGQRGPAAGGDEDVGGAPGPPLDRHVVGVDHARPALEPIHARFVQ